MFIKTVQRALKYRVTDIQSVERIAVLQLTSGDRESLMPEIDQEYQSRTAYLDGSIADEVDLSVYDRLTDEDNNG